MKTQADGSADGSRTARIVAVANQKGGVGKSTTAVSLGAALAELGHKVLVVDLDPQGNASTGLGIRHESRDVTVYDVLAAEAPIESAIVPTQLDNLFAIPSTIDLAGAEIELVSQFSRELRLRRAIEPLRHGVYDYVFLDCPPSLGLLTVNALAAAEELLVPIQCEYYALEGLGQLLRNVRLVQQNVNTSLRLTGIVMTMFDPRTKLSEQVVAEVRKYFGDRVYRTIIPRTVRLSEAPGFGLPITSYDPGSKGAESYRRLAREVDERPPDESPLPAVDDVPAVVVPPPEPAPGRAPRPLVRPEGSGATEIVEVDPGFLEPDKAEGAEQRPSSEPPDRGALGDELMLEEPSRSERSPVADVGDATALPMDEVEVVEGTLSSTRPPASNASEEAEEVEPAPELEPDAPRSAEPSTEAIDGGNASPDTQEWSDEQADAERPGKRLRGLFRRGGRS